MNDSPPNSQAELSGVHPAPNIQKTPEIYELENLAVDRAGLIEAAMQRITPWNDKVVLDLGAGDGFHVPRFQERAAHVIAVEPHLPSLERMRTRLVGLDRVSILYGSAEAIPVPDHSVDIVHCRFAYFFGPGSDPGLRELERVICPGGSAFIIDNDLRSGTFASWVTRTPNWTLYDPDGHEQFYIDHGFKIERIASDWVFDRREDFESVIRIEFPQDSADDIIREHQGLTVDYHYLLVHRSY